MASNPQSMQSENNDRGDIPEVIRVEEHGTISLAFSDERVTDDDAFDTLDDQY